MKGVANQFHDLVKSLLPAGYTLRVKPLRGSTAGYVAFTRHIRVERIEDRNDLFIYLHEVGHVRCGHIRGNDMKRDNWLHEYEADIYAVTAMREAGIAVPREQLAHQKSLVRGLIEADAEGCHDDAVLKYAYGREWRKHRT